MSTIAERVAAGAAFLDEHDPDWWRADVERAIDLDTLDQEFGNVCVLGQRCPLESMKANRHTINRYEAQAVALSGIDVIDDGFGDWTIAHGFQSTSVFEGYQALTAEWKRVITERRSAS